MADQASEAVFRGARSYDLHAASVRAALDDRLAAGLLGDRSPLRAVVVPEAAQYLAGDHLAHVEPDQPDDEHAVATQVVLGELGEDAGLALRGVERAQLLVQVLDVTRYWT